ncbi:MAG: hypothetical protein GX153_10620 [Clostridiaceae bacterium]|jgi:hypothetical protein|nr:hypothetical protein [Clostridiaceae bacterium]
MRTAPVSHDPIRTFRAVFPIRFQATLPIPSVDGLVVCALTQGRNVPVPGRTAA